METRVEPASFVDAIGVCTSIHYEDQSIAIKLINRDRTTKEITSVRYTLGTVAEQIAQFDEWDRVGVEPFLLLATTDGQGQSLENMVDTWAVACDLDTVVDIDSWERHPFRPSIAIKTSEGRYHLIWILDHALVRTEAATLLTALATRLGADPTFANVTQAVRLPGFVNSKYDTRAALVGWSSGSRIYAVEQIKAAFDFDLSCKFLRARQPRFDAKLQLLRNSVAKEDLVDDVKSALEHISADSYDVWYRVGIALQPLGSTGYDLWFNWSKTSKKFDAQQMPNKWKALTKGHSIGVATIFALATKNGWRNPGFRKTSDAGGGNDSTERGLGRLVATGMSMDYAVVPSNGSTRHGFLFLHWNGTRYDVLSDIERRKAIERHVNEVKERTKGDRFFREYLTTKSGSNRGLDDLSDHVAEYLVDMSAASFADGYPYFGVKNGVLNLLSRELVPTFLRPLSLVSGGAVFDPEAKAELFIKTLGEIFQGDEEMIRTVIRLFGYVLLGNPKEHILIVLYGPLGRNGKSLLTEVLRRVFGEYAHAFPSSIILVKSHNNEGPTPAVAKLSGKRLATFSEPSPKHPLDAGMIKLMTGGEHITARPLHGPLIEFVPEFTPVIVANRIPAAPDDDSALWRRLKIIRFDRTFSDDEIDVDLPVKLRREDSGILNLLLDGIQDYLVNGLNLPEKIESAGIEQRKSFDPFESWREECTMDTGKATETALHVLAANYEAWASANRQFRRMTKKELSAKLVAKGYEKVDRRRYPHFCGLMLKAGPAA